MNRGKAAVITITLGQKVRSFLKDKVKFSTSISTSNSTLEDIRQPIAIFPVSMSTVSAVFLSYLGRLQDLSKALTLTEPIAQTKS